MSGIRFQSYKLSDYNPFSRFPHGKLVVAEADVDGLYSLHVQLKNGYGLSSIDKFSLLEVERLINGYAQELEYPRSVIWLDLPDHVLEQPILFNKKLKRYLQNQGLYWKKSKQ